MTNCPGRQDAYTTYWDDVYGVHKIGGYVCECVSYAGWKAYEAYGVAPAWGNAYSWDDDFEKKLNVVLDAYPEYKDYVEYVNLGVASEESLEQITNAFDTDKYPSLIPADASIVPPSPRTLVIIVKSPDIAG